ncbi:MAG: SWIM zinc finger family protein [Planctomycetes bacterium]|nr:SWIM zinc finger family protein [Planctomycetota bacterium]
MWYREYYHFPKSRPRVAKGGIKAQSKGGNFGKSWWARRWLAVLESFNLGGRLSRGRSYARGGQVLSIDIEEGRVHAKVQGSRPKPYEVEIKVKPLTKAQWQAVANALSRQALFAAKLLAGEMPQEIEQVFEEVKIPLFPKTDRDLATDCSCPDWSNPCKHVAAVYCLLGEEFDRDPFLIFKLRGQSREALVKSLGKNHQKSPLKKAKAAQEAPTTAEKTVEPLPSQPEEFWRGAALPEDFFGPVERPPVTAALPKRLGAFPFWRGEERFLDALEPIYRSASERGLKVHVGERDS